MIRQWNLRVFILGMCRRKKTMIQWVWNLLRSWARFKVPQYLLSIKRISHPQYHQWTMTTMVLQAISYLTTVTMDMTRAIGLILDSKNGNPREHPYPFN